MKTNNEYFFASILYLNLKKNGTQLHMRMNSMFSDFVAKERKKDTATAFSTVFLFFSYYFIVIIFQKPNLK